jgi:hypothetical protein
MVDDDEASDAFTSTSHGDAASRRAWEQKVQMNHLHRHRASRRDVSRARLGADDRLGDSVVRPAGSPITHRQIGFTPHTLGLDGTDAGGPISIRPKKIISQSRYV